MKPLLKIFFVFYLLNLCSSKAYSETVGDSSKTKPYELKKFIFSVEGAPQYCYRFIETYKDKRTLYADNYTYYNPKLSPPVESYNVKNDKAGYGFFAGIYGNAKLYKGLRWKFGFTFEKFRYGTDKIDTFYIAYPKVVNPTGSTPDIPAHTDKFVNNTQVSYNYNFLTMPLTLAYYFKVSSKLYVNVDLGIALVSELSGTEYRTILNSNGIYNERHAFSGFDFGFSWKGILNCTNDVTGGGSVGINYFVSSKASISFAPFFKSSLQDYFNKYSGGSSIKFYSFGAKLGVNF